MIGWISLSSWMAAGSAPLWQHAERDYRRTVAPANRKRSADRRLERFIRPGARPPRSATQKVALKPGQLADRLNFGVPVRPSIGLQQVCKPKLRNRRVRVVPGVPRNVGLGLTGDQPPIDRTNVVPLRNRQDPVDGTAQGPRQVLGAEDRPPQRG